MRTRTIGLAAAAALAGVAAWIVAGAIRDRQPFTVAESALSGWTIAVAPPAGAAVVELQPPAQLTDDLFQQVARRAGAALVKPAHFSVPLVLAEEYADSLQGVWSVEDLVDAALDAALDSTRFEPICIGDRDGGSGRVWFAKFEARAFGILRQQLTPLFPEHAGSGVYVPQAVGLMLTVGTTDGGAGSAPPVGTGQADCRAPLRARP
jgi:hypothetical protein